jgi:hypothetical protein
MLNLILNYISNDLFKGTTVYSLQVLFLFYLML